MRILINKRIIIGSALAAAVATTAMILAHKEIRMAKMESTVTVARPVEEVFRFFLDLDRNARNPAIAAVLSFLEEHRHAEAPSLQPTSTEASGG